MFYLDKQIQYYCTSLDINFMYKMLLALTPPFVNLYFEIFVIKD